MAKFAIECPKCGSINMAQTGLFAQKIIKCGTCNEEINIKTSRMTSKLCPHCGRTFVYDQASGKEKKCPSCGEKLNALQAATGKYRFERINCPQCACSIEVDASCEVYDCPVCDHKINVKKEIEKAKLVSNSTVSVIQYEGDNSTFVWKHPIEDFNSGSILNVHESQEAILFVGGRMLDTFERGRHILDTESLPILKSVYPIPTGGQSPFHAEVYFINKTVHMSMNWGTPQRINFVDPITKQSLDIGAGGVMHLYVSDARKLLTKLVGTATTLINRQLLSAEGSGAKSLQGLFREPVAMVVKSFLASEISKRVINILEIDQYLVELSAALLPRVSDVFEDFGLAVSHFYISRLDLPEDNRDFKEIKAMMSARYRELEKRKLDADIAVADREARIERKRTELEEARLDKEIRIINAEGEAAEKIVLGKAESEVMRDKGYTGKDELDAVTQRTWAENYGKSSSNGGSGGGAGHDVVSTVVGIKAAGMVLDQVDSAMGTTKPQSAFEDPIAVLTQLKQMFDMGLIEKSEYDAKKQEILSRM